MNVSTVDLAIVALYLAGIVLFGLWVGRRQGSVSEYLLGDRNLPWWLLLLSIVATETSSVTFLSVPGTAYTGNLTFLQLAMGYVLGRYAVAGLLLPHYFRGQLFSAYEVLERRFGGATKQAASALFLVTRSLADGLRLFLCAIVLKAMLFPAAPANLGERAFDWQLAVAVLVIGGATIGYTFLGGMKAVAWTDFAQFFIYVAGAVVAGVIILMRLPEGWAGMAREALQEGKLRLFDTEFDLTRPYTLWAGLAGGAFISLGSHGADQLMVQRYLSARSQREAALALTLSGWVVLVQFACFLLLGVGLWGFFGNRQFKGGDQVFVTFIVEQLPVGAVGLTLAAVLAATMSTISSSLNSLAAVASRDFNCSLAAPQTAGVQSLRVTRGLTVLFGLVQIGVAACGQYLQGSVIEAVLAIAGFTTGIVLGIFFLGVLTRRVSQPAALAALVCGLGGMTYVAFGTKLSWTWFALAGSCGTFVLGLVASLLWPQREPPSCEIDNR
ncbi:MAG: sodium/solute symporter [Planctomycetes bacterium]|nr:sodium/solute symporter [Planctomycetota bacterium]